MPSGRAPVMLLRVMSNQYSSESPTRVVGREPDRRFWRNERYVSDRMLPKLAGRGPDREQLPTDLQHTHSGQAA